MATYTDINGVKLIDTGDEAGTWGSSTNVNLQIIERAANGFAQIALTGTTKTLTLSNQPSAAEDGHYKAIEFTGTPGGACTVTLEQNDHARVYMFLNNTNQNVIITQGSGGNVTIAASDGAIILADGAGSGAQVKDLTATLQAETATKLATARDFSISGDITASAVSFDGTGNVALSSAITADTIVNADINSSAAIADTKLAQITTSSKVANSATTATNANTASAIVARDGSGDFSAGTITANLTGNASGSSGSCTGNAATATALASGQNFSLTGDVTASAVSFNGSGAVALSTAIASGVIVNADINASAAIADTKLDTISTSGKVSNSATTATDANTASAIVARDSSGNFSAGTITATLSGNANTATTAGTVTTAAQPNITSLGSLTTLTVDDITINDSTISDSGDFTIDAGGDIILDADGADITFKDGGTAFGRFSKSSDNFIIESQVQDGDMKLQGNDGGIPVVALSFDMANAGAATFNSSVTAASISVDDITIDGSTISDSGDFTIDAGGDIILDTDGGDIQLHDGGTLFGQIRNESSNLVFKCDTSDKDIIFKGKDGLANDLTVLTLDLSEAGAAIFNSTVTANAGVIVDNITIDGQEIDVSSGDLTLDVSGDIILDSDGGQVFFKDNGTEKLQLNYNSSGKTIFYSGDNLDIEIYGGGTPDGTNQGDVKLYAGGDFGSIVLSAQGSSGSTSSDINITASGIIDIQGDAGIRLDASIIHFSEDPSADRLELSFPSDEVHLKSETAGKDFLIRAVNSSSSTKSVVWDPDLPSWRPNADNLYNLGSGSARWAEIFAGNSTINTSDRSLKQDIESISEAEVRVAKVLKGLLRKYRWISAVEEKGDAARIHFGVVAQDIQKAFEDEGLDPFKYSMLCKDTYWETGVDEERIVYNTAEEAPSDAVEKVVWAVRYSELLAFIIAGL